MPDGQRSPSGVFLFERTTGLNLDNSNVNATGRDHINLSINLATGASGYQHPFQVPPESSPSFPPNVTQVSRPPVQRLSFLTRVYRRFRIRRRRRPPVSDPDGAAGPCLTQAAPKQQPSPGPPPPSPSPSSDVGVLPDGSSITSFDSPSQSSLIQRDNSSVGEAYERSLLPKGEGFPLFNPPPFDERPIRLGDFGILVGHDAFESFGNLYDPNNQQKFSIDPLPQPITLRQSEKLHEGQVITEGIEDARRPTESDANAASRLDSFEFHCRESQGAALALTSSGDLETLTSASKSQLKEYLCSHGTHLMVQLRQKGHLKPGQSLYVVTGTIKSDSWAIAVHTSPMQEPYDRMVLSKRECKPGSTSPIYKWACCGGAHARSGASQVIGADGQRSKDQCLFLRGFLLTPSLDLERQTMTSPAGSSPSGESSPSPDPHESDNYGDTGSSEKSGRDKSQEPNHSSASSRGCSQNHLQDIFQRANLVQPFPSLTSDSKPYYPSQRINDNLLENSNASLAITHDDEWSGIFKGRDGYLDEEALSIVMGDFWRENVSLVCQGVATTTGMVQAENPQENESTGNNMDAQCGASGAIGEDGGRAKDQCLSLQGVLLTPSPDLEQQSPPDTDDDSDARGSGSDSSHSKDTENARRKGDRINKTQRGSRDSGHKAATLGRSLQCQLGVHLDTPGVVQPFPTRLPSDSKHYYPSRCLSELLLKHESVDLAITHDDDDWDKIFDGYLDEFWWSNIPVASHRAATTLPSKDRAQDRRQDDRPIVQSGSPERKSAELGPIFVPFATPRLSSLSGPGNHDVYDNYWTAAKGWMKEPWAHPRPPSKPELAKSGFTFNDPQFDQKPSQDNTPNTLPAATYPIRNLSRPNARIECPQPVISKLRPFPRISYPGRNNSKGLAQNPRGTKLNGTGPPRALPTTAFAHEHCESGSLPTEHPSTGKNRGHHPTERWGVRTWSPAKCRELETRSFIRNENPLNRQRDDRSSHCSPLSSEGMSGCEVPTGGSIGWGRRALLLGISYNSNSSWGRNPQALLQPQDHVKAMREYLLETTACSQREAASLADADDTPQHIHANIMRGLKWLGTSSCQTILVSYIGHADQTTRATKSPTKYPSSEHVRGEQENHIYDLFIIPIDADPLGMLDACYCAILLGLLHNRCNRTRNSSGLGGMTNIKADHEVAPLLSHSSDPLRLYPRRKEDQVETDAVQLGQASETDAGPHYSGTLSVAIRPSANLSSPAAPSGTPPWVASHLDHHVAIEAYIHLLRLCGCKESRSSEDGTRSFTFGATYPNWLGRYLIEFGISAPTSTIPYAFFPHFLPHTTCRGLHSPSLFLFSHRRY